MNDVYGDERWEALADGIEKSHTLPLFFSFPLSHLCPVTFHFIFIPKSPNKPSNPQERIRPLTSLDHPQSPFYDPSGSPMAALARVIVERIARKVILKANMFILKLSCLFSL